MSFEDIIAKVKQHPDLWQPSHPFFKNRFKNARTWFKIAKELEVDELVIRKKWKHLRDQYRKEQKKIAAKTIPMTFWKYYKDLHFLSEDHEHYDPRQAELKMLAAVRTANEVDSGSESDSDDEPLQAKRPKKAAQISQDPNLFLTHILKRLNSMEDEIESLSPEDEMKMIDPDYMFILSTLPMMKKLTEIQKLQFRGNINDWLLEIVTQNELLRSVPSM